MSNPNAKGRASTIRLTANGQTKTIKGWAEVAYPDNPKKGEYVIRDRFQRRRKGQQLSDAQIVYGLSYLDMTEQPLAMGLPQLCRIWVQEAFNLVMPQIEDHISLQVAKYLSQNVTDIYKEAGKETPAETPVRSVQTPLKKPRTEVIVGFKPDPSRLEIIEQWLDKQGLENRLVAGDYLATQLLSQCSDQELTEEVVGWMYKLWMDSEKELTQEVQPVAVSGPEEGRQHLSVKLLVAAASEPNAQPYEVDESVRLTEQEVMELEAIPFIREFAQTSTIPSIGETIIGRMLRSQTEYNCLVANHTGVQALLATPNHEGFSKFLEFALFDIGFRCALQIHDFETFNRAQQVYFLSSLCRKFQVAMLGRNPDIVDSMLEKLAEWGINPYHLTKFQDHPLLGYDIYRNNIDAVQSKLAPLVKYAEDRKLPLMLDGNWATRSEYDDGDTLIELSPMFLPEDIDDIDDVIKSMEYTTNYGRNRAMWPKVKGLDGEYDLPVPRPDLIPCELYNNAAAGHDYSVFGGAPILKDGGHTFVVIRGKV